MFVYPSSQNAYGKSNGIAQEGSNKEKKVFLIPSTTKTQCENLVNFLQLRFYVKSNQLRQLQSFKSSFTKLISRKILSCRKIIINFHTVEREANIFFRQNGLHFSDCTKRRHLFFF